jgi:hypothetical protein
VAEGEVRAGKRENGHAGETGSGRLRLRRARPRGRR